jgi:Family of unknown function (DUF6498)
MVSTQPTASRWTSAWPDVLAFALGLGVARFAGWTTTDLVWSLWLSSLVVGYSMVVWMIVRPALAIARGARQDADLTAQLFAQARLPVIAGAGILVSGGLFMLGFFTVHFGGFHYVHSQLLNGFFPLDGTPAGRGGTAGMDTYLEVARRYWTFLPAAFLAERTAFLNRRTLLNLRNSGSKMQASAAMLAPYRNVIRMHLLIFFFAFAHFAAVDSFVVYTIVYAVYFFPWRLVRGSRTAVAA